jgi:hypothetical protein
MSASFHSFTDEMLKIAGLGGVGLGMMAGGVGGYMTAKPTYNPTTGQYEKPGIGKRIGRAVGGALLGGVGGHYMQKGISRLGSFFKK